MQESTVSHSRPSNEELRRREPGVIDQRQQQIDPAGRQRTDRDARPDANRKQPGGKPPDDDGTPGREVGA